MAIYLSQNQKMQFTNNEKIIKTDKNKIRFMTTKLFNKLN